MSFKKIKIKHAIFLVLTIVIVTFGWPFFRQTYFSFDPSYIDPHNSKFNPEKFQYSDYIGKNYQHYFADALRATFPIGTPRATVNRILLENQNRLMGRSGGDSYGIDAEKPEEKNFFYYYYKPRGIDVNIYLIQVYYDQNNKVKEVADHGVPLFNKNFYKGK
jgi:hypothetical protein